MHRLSAVRVKVKFDEGGVYSMLTVQSLANKYENIKHIDSCLTVFGQSSTFSVTVIKTQSISVDKADFEKTFQF